MEHKYIDAVALLDKLNEQFRDMDNNLYDSQDDALEDAEVSVRQIIYNMPAVDVEQVKLGHWINLGMRVADTKAPTHYCSECGMHGFDNYKRCPNCGAKMDGGSEE